MEALWKRKKLRTLTLEKDGKIIACTSTTNAQTEMTDIHKLLLTFDIEDFVNSNAIGALRIVLEMLQRYKLRAIFFVTGHMAEKLANFSEILDMLKDHEIGFHSSAHSVRPIILEYTDVESYKQAYSLSLKRETAHINPLTGAVEGEGGICFLNNLFHPKKITAYRAPGNSWSPPNLEALVELGIRYDFSSDLTTSTPVRYKGIIFYPNAFTQQWEGTRLNYQCTLSALMKQKVSVFDLHPTLYVNQRMWDSIYYKHNPEAIYGVQKRTPKESESFFAKLELFLKQIALMRKTKLVEMDPNFSESTKKLIVTKNDAQKSYETSIGWPLKFFNYKPRFVRSHFYKFFDIDC